MGKKKRDYVMFLEDIIDSTEKMEKFVDGLNLEKFKEDEKTIFAVIKAFEIIGEATKNIPARVKNKYKEVPWRQMAGMRNVLIHEYFGVNMNRVWKTIKEDMPDLKNKISKMLEESKKNKLL